jgi:hypothetical protein
MYFDLIYEEQVVKLIGYTSVLYFLLCIKYTKGAARLRSWLKAQFSLLKPFNRCDITSHNDILKTQYFTLIKYFYKQIQGVNSYEINTYTKAIFKFFRYVFVKKTILF